MPELQTPASHAALRPWLSSVWHTDTHTQTRRISAIWHRLTKELIANDTAILWRSLLYSENYCTRELSSIPLLVVMSTSSRPNKTIVCGSAKLGAKACFCFRLSCKTYLIHRFKHVKATYNSHAWPHLLCVCASMYRGGRFVVN